MFGFVGALALLAVSLLLLLAVATGALSSDDDSPDVADSAEPDPVDEPAASADEPEADVPPDAGTEPATSAATAEASTSTAVRDDLAVPGFDGGLGLATNQATELEDNTIAWSLGVNRSGEICLHYITETVIRACAPARQPRAATYVTASGSTARAVAGAVHWRVEQVALITTERTLDLDLFDYANQRTFSALLEPTEAPQTLEAFDDRGNLLWTIPLGTGDPEQASAFSDTLLAYGTEHAPVEAIGSSTIDGIDWSVARYGDSWFCLDLPEIGGVGYPATPGFSADRVRVTCNTHPMHGETLASDLSFVVGAVPGCATTITASGENGTFDIVPLPASNEAWALISATPPFRTEQVTIARDDGREALAWRLGGTASVPASFCDEQL